MNQKSNSWDEYLDRLAEKLVEFGYESCPICGVNPKKVKSFISKLIKEERKRVYHLGAIDGEDAMAENYKKYIIPKLIKEERKKVIEEIEKLQVQLAGCSVAALGGIKNIVRKGDYGWSQSYQDVLDLRKEFEKLKTKIT